MERAYEILSQAARRAAPLLALGGPKVARAVHARRDAADRLVAWAERERAPDRPLVWFHAPSVGEGLQARAVLESLRAATPRMQVVFTHFSPSAEALAARMPAEFAGTLPWDVPEEAGRAARAVRPDLLCFTKTEVWPVLAGAARAVGSRTALVAATVPDGSSRARWPVRAVVRPTLAALDLVAAVDDSDAERLILLGVRNPVMQVTGDPGIDSAAQRVAAADPYAPHLRPLHAARRPTLVAGSTWPTDEAVLVPACLELKRTHPTLRVVAAPHEPEEDAMRALEERVRAEGWRTARLAEVERMEGAADADLIVVDRVGVLAELYTTGDFAWVGGGFHGAGLHSVLEPAAAGVPIVFGPRHRSAPAAAELLARGGARVVTHAEDAAATLGAWLADREALASAGAAGRDYIQGHRGAAERTAAFLSDLMGGAGAR
jgi:3-deoxy-D-manno-octulosonic-acid transferase